METTSVLPKNYPANLPLALQVRLYPNGMTTVVIDKDFPTPKPKDAAQDEFFSLGSVFCHPRLVDIIARHVAYWDRPQYGEMRNMPNDEHARESCYRRLRDGQRFELDRAIEGALLDFFEVHLLRRHPTLKTKPQLRGPDKWHPSQNIDWNV